MVDMGVRGGHAVGQGLPLWPRMVMLLAELRRVGLCPDRCSGLLGQSFPTTREKEGVTLR